ncbi:hypothetical protein Bca4012_023855 [Brassica carinata]
MGNCIHTLCSKHGNIVRDFSLDGAATKKINELPQEVAEQKTGKRRCIKIILTKKQLELLLLKCPEGVSFKLPETYGSCTRKWKPSLQTIEELGEDNTINLCDIDDDELEENETMLILEPEKKLSVRNS